MQASKPPAKPSGDGPLRPGPHEAFLDENQLAARHQRSVKTLRNDRLRGGYIPYVKLNRMVRYRLSDIEAWEQANLRQSTSDAGANHD